MPGATTMTPPPTAPTARWRRTVGSRPRWWVEVLAIGWLLWAYDTVTDLGPFRKAEAVAHAHDVLRLERWAHLDPEIALNHWLAGHHTLGLVLSEVYDNAHFVVTFAVVAWLWWRHPHRYPALRTSLVLINVIGFLVYWRFPTAPPRLVPGLHVVDIVATSGAIGSAGTLANHANELAAMPSLHMAWATWSAFAVWRVLRHRPWAILIWAYPLATALIVLSTGNHYLIDVLAGLVTAAVAIALANRWYRYRADRRLHHRHDDDDIAVPPVDLAVPLDGGAAAASVGAPPVHRPDRAVITG